MLKCPVMSDSANPWTIAYQSLLSMGIPQARILEWIAMPSSRGSSRPRDRTRECPVSPAPRADSLLVEPSGKLSFREKMPTDRDGLGFLNVLVLRSLCFFSALPQRDSCYYGCRHGVVLP